MPDTFYKPYDPTQQSKFGQPAQQAAPQAGRRPDSPWYTRLMGTAQTVNDSNKASGSSGGLLDRAMQGVQLAKSIRDMNKDSSIDQVGDAASKVTGAIDTAKDVGKTVGGALAGGGATLGATTVAPGIAGGVTAGELAAGATGGAGSAAAGGTSVLGALPGIGLVASVPLLAKGVNAFGDWLGSKMPDWMYGRSAYDDWDSYAYYASNRGETPTDEGYQTWDAQGRPSWLP